MRKRRRGTDVPRSLFKNVLPTALPRLRLQRDARRLRLWRHRRRDWPWSRHDNISRRWSTARILRQPWRRSWQSRCGSRKSRRRPWKPRRRSGQSGLSSRQCWRLARQTRWCYRNLRRHAGCGWRRSWQCWNFTRHIRPRRNGVGQSWKPIREPAEPVGQRQKPVRESSRHVAAGENVGSAQVRGGKRIRARKRCG